MGVQCVDRTSEFRAVVRRHRSVLGGKTTSEEILPRKKQRSAFSEDAQSALHNIQTISNFLRDNHAAYMLEVGGLSDSERDEVDTETQRSLKMCGARIDQLKDVVDRGSHAAPHHLAMLPKLTMHSCFAFPSTYPHLCANQYIFNRFSNSLFSTGLPQIKTL